MHSVKAHNIQKYNYNDLHVHCIPKTPIFLFLNNSSKINQF